MFRYSLRLMLCGILFLGCGVLAWQRMDPWGHDHTEVSKILPTLTPVDPSNSRYFSHLHDHLRLMDKQTPRIFYIFNNDKIRSALIKVRPMREIFKGINYEFPDEKGFIDDHTVVFVYGLKKDIWEFSQQDTYILIYFTNYYSERWRGHLTRIELWLMLIFGALMVYEFKRKPWLKPK